MSEINLFHSGSRKLQREFGTVQLADRLVDVLAHQAFTASDRQFIESSTMFFLSTADDSGRPDCSYKGGGAGFVRVVGPDLLEFPSYDGNGMYKSLGNILVNPHIGLLFIDFGSPRRLRVNGRATVSRLQSDTGAQSDDRLTGVDLIVRVQADAIFPNCPRYIHPAKTLAQSEYVPKAGHTAPIPEWKTREQFNSVLPASDLARRK